ALGQETDVDTCDVFPEVKCSSDCSALIICYNEILPSVSVKCPANKPHCVNGKCGKIRRNCPTAAMPSTSDFVCTADGTYPDPTDCTNSYECKDGIATKTPCDSGFIFDSKNNDCVRGVPRADHASKKICRKISCDTTLKGYILFPANPTFYAYCSRGFMILYKCKDHEVFDIRSEKCIFECTSAGSFVDPADCTVYHICKGTHKFKLVTMNCEAGQYYDGTSCVPGKCDDIPTEPNPTPSIPPTTPTPPTSPTLPPNTPTSVPGDSTTNPGTGITTELNPTSPVTSPTSVPGDSTTNPGTGTTTELNPTSPVTSPTSVPGDSTTNPGTSITTELNPTSPVTSPTSVPGDSTTNPGTSITTEPNPTSPVTSPTSVPGDSTTNPGTSITTEPNPTSPVTSPTSVPGDSTTNPGTSITTEPNPTSPVTSPTSVPGDSTTNPGTSITTEPNPTSPVTSPTSVPGDSTTNPGTSITTELNPTSPPTPSTSTPSEQPPLLSTHTSRPATIPSIVALDHLNLQATTKTTLSPRWKHKGKYSVRVSKFAKN
ncbi:Immunoglobulin A1 protease, partial [Pseudolycoriella hygida]